MAFKIATIIEALKSTLESVPAGVYDTDGGFTGGFQHITQMTGPAEGLGMVSDRKFLIQGDGAVVGEAMTTAYEFSSNYSVVIFYVVAQDLKRTTKRIESDTLLVYQILRNPGAWVGGSPAGLRACVYQGHDAPLMASDDVFAVTHRFLIRYSES